MYRNNPDFTSIHSSINFAAIEFYFYDLITKADNSFVRNEMPNFRPIFSVFIRNFGGTTKNGAQYPYNKFDFRKKPNTPLEVKEFLKDKLVRHV